jgi:sulfotransferase family protein
VRKMPEGVKGYLRPLVRKEKFPDFLIIGAQKAGTTWLHRNLQAHPQIWMPKEKELHYFDEKLGAKTSLRSKLWGKRAMDERWRRQIRRQMGRYSKFSASDIAWDLKYFLGSWNDRWYASLFTQGAGKTVGETTPDYSVLGRNQIAHVHDIMPEAKIIFLMRNPIERAWSQSLMDLRERNLEDVSDEEFQRHFERKRSRKFTDYLRTLEDWGEYFDERQIFVGFLEDIHFYPNRLLARLYRFLGVDPSGARKVIRRKIHSRDVETMPTRLAVGLAEAHLEDASRLEDRFGGYASFWRYSAQRLVEDPPEGERIAYPLWGSSLWGDWAKELGLGPEPGSREASPQSGRLPSVLAAR